MVPSAIVGAESESPFPPANVARLPKNASGKKSAVLVARSMQYLAVRVLFHGVPVPGLKVQFAQIDDIDDQAPQKMEPQLTTPENGVVCFPRLVVAGIYSCEVERQPATIVPTVGHLQEPYPIVLPVGRPLIEIRNIDEFLLRPVQIGQTERDGVDAQTAAPDDVDKELTAKIVARTYENYGDEEFDEEPLRLHYVCVGTAEGEGIKARLNIIATGYIDLDGALIRAPPEDGEPPPEPLTLPAGQKLYVFVHRKPAEVAKGMSKIPIALCDEIGADGAICHRRLARDHTWEFQILEQPIVAGSDGPSLGAIEQREPEQVAADELQRAFRELADAVRSQRGDQ